MRLEPDALQEVDEVFGAAIPPGDNGEYRPEATIRNIEDLKPMTSFGDSEISWVVDGFLAEGTITLLTSEPGEGKTTLAAEIGYRISRGEPFAGRATSPRPVLILDRENPRQ
ncbi:MAG: AAA family ATPase, partial [Candidatus Sumerlaeota bacterium]|nr:AAA family ATPase [Candidatus Sumerlaeota bacterium]